MNGYVDCMNALLEAGAYVDAQTTAGRTALHVAASSGFVGCVEALLLSGADVDVKDKRGDTALHRASKNGREGVVTLIVQSGADVNARDLHGRTALQCATTYALTDCVKVLTSSSLRRTNVLARVARFAVFDDFYDEFVLGTVGLYESLFERVLRAVESRLSLAECRLVCTTWRHFSDSTLAARPVEFFAPASMAT
jgi:ankyrin repeat protein